MAMMYLRVKEEVWTAVVYLQSDILLLFSRGNCKQHNPLLHACPETQLQAWGESMHVPYQ